MFKKCILLLLPFLLLGCNRDDDASGPCPQIRVRQDTLSALGGAVQVSIKGYEGHCYYHEGSRTVQAQITPVFEAVRNETGDESDIFFTYYTETIIGPPEYLGRKVRNEKFTIPEGSFHKFYRGKTFQMRIPAGLENTYSIEMGIVFSPRNKI